MVLGGLTQPSHVPGHHQRCPPQRISCRNELVGAVADTLPPCQRLLNCASSVTTVTVCRLSELTLPVT
jgi:hypothetical protein